MPFDLVEIDVWANLIWVNPPATFPSDAGGDTQETPSVSRIRFDCRPLSCESAKCRNPSEDLVVEVSRVDATGTQLIALQVTAGTLTCDPELLELSVTPE